MKEIDFIDFKNLTTEQEEGIKKLIIAMQQELLNDINHIKETGVQILGFGSEKISKGENDFPLDFKNLDEETAKALSSTINTLQQSLIERLNFGKNDTDEKGILMDTPKGVVNFNRNEIIEAVSNLSIIGIWMLQLHWEYTNNLFKPKAKPASKSFTQKCALFFKRMFGNY